MFCSRVLKEQNTCLRFQFLMKHHDETVHCKAFMNIHTCEYLEISEPIPWVLSWIMCASAKCGLTFNVVYFLFIPITVIYVLPQHLETIKNNEVINNPKN